MADLQIHLGDIVRDKITGFEGSAESITHFRNACARVGVQPTTLDKDGAVRKAEGFDIVDLELIRCSHAKPPDDPHSGGPDRPIPSRRG